MSNAERQQNFQQAHPGYDRKRKARERAAFRRDSARCIEALYAKVAADAKLQTPTLPKPVLMLPAPAVDPLLDEINALHHKLKQPHIAA